MRKTKAPQANRWIVALFVLLALSLQSGCGEDSTSPMGEPVTWIRGHVHTIPDSRYGFVRLENYDRRGTPEVRVRQTLDIDGKFAFPVAEGVYEIRLEMPDQQFDYVQRDGSLGSDADSIVAIAGTETEFDIHLGSLLLTLDYPEGYDNDRVTLWLRPVDDWTFSSYQRGRTASRETYRLGHLSPGRYTYDLSLGSEYPLIGIEREGVHIETLVVSADEETAYDAVLPEPAWIEFEVSDPTEVVSVGVFSYPGTSLRKFAHVGAGASRVPVVGVDSVFVQGYLGATRFLSPTGQSADTTILVLSPDETLTLPVEVARLYVSPHIPRVQLELYSDEGEYEGWVSLASNPAIWAERFYGRIRPDPRYGGSDRGAPHWLGDALRRIDSEPIDATSGTEELSWAIFPGGTVRGRLAEPHNYVSMFWTEADAPYHRSGADADFADDRQSFEIHNAPIGEFYLGFNSFGDAAFYPGTGTIDSAEVIRIEPGAVHEGLDFAR